MAENLPLHGIILAAGLSTRMRGASKLLLEVDGKPVVRRAAQSLASAGITPLLVVTGPEGRAVREALLGIPALFAENPAPERGMASSIAIAVASLPPDARSAMIMLGDMPLVKPGTVRLLAEEFGKGGKSIAVPVLGGRRGHPAIFDLNAHRAALLALTGDEGARRIIENNPEAVLEVAVDDEGVTRDFDTPEEFSALGLSGISRSAGLMGALGAGRGDLVTLVGAGGKTTLMYRLAGELLAAGIDAVCATTTKIAPPDPAAGFELLLGESAGILSPLLAARRFSPRVIGSRVREDGKVVGVAPEVCDDLMGGKILEALVVEADGSRRLPLKAPGENEPVVPRGTTLFVCVVGLSCLFRPLGPETAFRHELVGSLAGLREGEILTPESVAKLLTASGGLSKGKPNGARSMVFLNQADTPQLLDAAAEIARLALDAGSLWGKVVAGRLAAKTSVEAIWDR